MSYILLSLLYIAIMSVMRSYKGMTLPWITKFPVRLPITYGVIGLAGLGLVWGLASMWLLALVLVLGTFALYQPPVGRGFHDFRWMSKRYALWSIPKYAGIALVTMNPMALAAIPAMWAVGWIYEYAIMRTKYSLIAAELTSGAYVGLVDAVIIGVTCVI